IEGVLVTLFNGRTPVHKTNVHSLYRFLQVRKIDVLDEKISQTIKLGESVYQYQQPAVMVKEYKQNTAVMAYHSVAKQIIDKYSK
uniref:hypothetical protein n=1 Tax=Staphylococcus haemolyticus TaxID=1283 RepID=UPI0015D7CE47